MVFSYDYVKQKRGQQKTNAPLSWAIWMAMLAHWSDTDSIAWCGMSRATPEATGCRHRASTHSILSQRLPGQQETKQQQKHTPTFWPFWWPWQCAGTLPHTSPNRGGPWLNWKPLSATIGQVFAKIEAIGHGYPVYLCFFSWSTHWKRASDDVKTPFNNRSVTYQTKGKDKEDMMEHLNGSARLGE